MKVVLVAGTPAEHAVGVIGATGGKDFAAESYNYAIGLLEACVLADAEARGQVTIVRKDFPVTRTQSVLPEEQLDGIVREQADVVGFSCYCWSRDLLLEGAARLRVARPELVVVLGGPSVSWGATDLLAANPSVDIVVRGEGERAFVELCRRQFRDVREIPNVTCRHGGAVVDNPIQETVEDLGALPSPYLDGRLRPLAPSLLVEPSRGCRYRCSFCAWSTCATRMRYVPAERLRCEIIWARSSGYRGISFCDTAVNHDTERLRELVAVLQSADPERSLAVSLFLRHEELDAEQLDLLAGIRCDEIIMGLESTSPAALEACAKPPLRAEDLERNLAALAGLGHRVTLSIMSGLPGDSLAGFEKTIAYCDGLLQRLPEAVNFICVFWLAVLPGTRFAEQSSRHGFRVSPRGTPYIESSNDWSADDLAAAASLVVERADADPRFRCEELHRHVAARRRRFDSSARGAPAERSLLAPWTLGGVRDGWRLVSVSQPPAEEGVALFAFSSEASGDLEIAVAVRDNERASFSRTASHNIHYRGSEGGPAVVRLLETVTRLVRENEG